jgi:polyhydroxyalkanoate synthesis regulator phasin
MNNNLNLRSILLAGIGSIAYSLEKGMEMIDELVKKGELTVSQGKELNQELKNRFAQECKGQSDQDLTAIKDELQKLEARVSALETKLP